MAKILRIDGENIKPLEKAKFNLESDLQDYLEKYPSIIPLEEIVEDASELRCIGREVTVPSGAIDLMYIDKEGLITIVETKLVKNPEIRRTVIGQLLEYASFVSQWKAADISEVAYNYLTEKSDEEMASLFLGEFFEDYIKIEDNLQNGRIRLIIAVDELNEPLRATVTFLNSHSNFDILLLQVSSFEESKSKKVITSSLFGYAQKTSSSRPSRKQWDETSFFNDVKERAFEPTTVNVINQLFEFSKINADNINWGTGASYGSFTFRKFTASVFTVQSDGRMYLAFGGMIGKVKEEALHSFIKALNEIPSLKIPEDAATRNVYPYMKVEVLAKPNSLRIFQNAVLTLCEHASVKE